MRELTDSYRRRYAPNPLPNGHMRARQGASDIRRLCHIIDVLHDALLCAQRQLPTEAQNEIERRIRIASSQQ